MQNRKSSVYIEQQPFSNISKEEDTNMKQRQYVSFVLVSMFALAAFISFRNLQAQAAPATLSPNEQLGKSIFFDTNLSINKNQSCASCHAPESGWTGPDFNTNLQSVVYEGSIPGRFGNRKPPSAAYATLSPIFHQAKSGGEYLYVGGNFWDGRATGQMLGNPAADQAQGPFLNPAEQALTDSACIVYQVCTAVYPVDFTVVWGSDSCDISWPSDSDATCATEGGILSLSPDDRAQSYTSYDQIALSIASYEASAEVNSFSSKFDATLNGDAKLSKLERRGFALFQGKGQCQRCHTSNGKMALFTDFTFDNLGLPKNPELAFYNTNPNFVDTGLGGFLQSLGLPEEAYMAEWGKQKVPTLRNVDLRPNDAFVKAYGHNGYFKSLEGIVHFYNTRDVKDACPGAYTEAQALAADCWPAPEVPENVNMDELGDLGLSAEEEAAIVAYLKTLSDGFEP
jgi:cytochrome c peroxidase